MKNSFWIIFALIMSAGSHAQTPKDHAGRTLDRTGATGFEVVESEVPSYIENPSLIWRQSEQGDEGLFFKGQDDSVVIFSNETTVRRFLSPMGNPYRFWQEQPSASQGGFPLPLVDHATFDNFLQHYQNRYEEGMKWCEVVEDPWTAWEVSGSLPTACGVQSYTEQRFCSTAGKADLACPVSCPAVETRSASIDNGVCAPAVVVEPDPPCVPYIAGPEANTIASGSTQTFWNGCANDIVVGTYVESVVPSCDAGETWSPAASSVVSGQVFTQSNSTPNACVATRLATGTQVAAPVAGVCAHLASDWLPNLAHYYNDNLVSQYRTYADCSMGYRDAYGLLPRAPACSVTSTGPDPSTIALGSTQSYWTGCEYATVVGTYVAPVCVASIAGPNPSSIAIGTTQSYWDGCQNITVTGTYTAPVCVPSIAPPDPSTVRSGAAVNHFNGCAYEVVIGTKVPTISCSHRNYTPAANTVLQGTVFTQYDDSEFRCPLEAIGTKAPVYVLTYLWGESGFRSGRLGSTIAGTECSNPNATAVSDAGYMLICLIGLMETR